jgi:hypothetical protein
MGKLFKRKGNGQEADRKIVANVSVGRAEGRQSASAHLTGVKSGNAKHDLDKDIGITRAPPDAWPDGGRATARRSTGINPKAHDPIDPRMPKLAPP